MATRKPPGVLFVCRENIGRSQVADALWKRKPRKVGSFSAGILVDIPGQEVGERPEAVAVIKVMNELYGIDVRHQVRSSINDIDELSLSQAGLIIVMAEPAIVPAGLKDRPNVLPWEVEDLKDQDDQATLEIIKGIESGVEDIASRFDY